MRGGGVRGLSQREYSCVHGAQINFGDLTPYLTYDGGSWGRDGFLEKNVSIFYLNGLTPDWTCGYNTSEGNGGSMKCIELR
jgi:hypothetical protein